MTHARKSLASRARAMAVCVFGSGLYTRRGDREHGQLDARVIHGVEAHPVEIRQPFLESSEGNPVHTRSWTVCTTGKARIGEMFFEGDLFHG